MVQRVALVLPLLLASACAQPIDPGFDDVRLRDAGSKDGGNNNNAPPEDDDTGAAEEKTDSASAPDDTGSGATDTGSSAAPDSSTPPDTAPPDTGTPDTGTPDTGTPDTGVADTGTPPVDSGTGTTITFPTFSDTFNILWDPNFWNKGDYIQGTRTTTLSSITNISGAVGIKNSLSSCGTLNVEVRVNSVAVGTMKITQATGATFPMNFTFAAATGPTYTIRYHATNTVSSGCGAITFNEDSTKLTLK